MTTILSISPSEGTCRFLFFFFQAEDGIRDYKVTGVQTCALPIYAAERLVVPGVLARLDQGRNVNNFQRRGEEIGRGAGGGRGWISGGAGSFKKKKKKSHNIHIYTCRLTSRSCIARRTVSYSAHRA